MTDSDNSTFYPHLREVLDDRFAALPDDALETLFAENVGPGLSPAEFEEFFGGLAKGINQFAQKAGPIAQGALKGASAGSIAGPWGALAGGVLGGAGSALQRHGRGSTRTVGKALGSVVGTAGALRGGGVSSMLGALGQSGSTQPAIRALRGVLGRPETRHALRALMGGSNRAIPVGGAQTPVPANAFAGLIGALAQEAEAEADTSGMLTLPAYLLDTDGQTAVDPIDPELRAARLLQLLANASTEDAEEDADIWEDSYEQEEAEYEDVWVDVNDDLTDADEFLDVGRWFEAQR